MKSNTVKIRVINLKINWKNLLLGIVLLAILVQVIVGIGVFVGYGKTTDECITNNNANSEFSEMEFPADPNAMCDKPMIYVYPTAEMGDTNVQIKLDFQGTLTTTYPKYDQANGWNIVASPDGTIKEPSGSREYYGLYWEGTPNKYFEFTEGNMVAGSDTAEFLETSLKTLGLTDKEAQEFIVYWLPKMEGNTYNFIQFQTSQYTDIAKLNINPAPDTLIRVFMTYRPYESIASYKIQDISKLAVQRSGYTVVEWGGSMI